MAEFLYQGHGSYRITDDDGTVVYIDPYAGGGYDLPADLVLVSHEHFDHNKVGLVKMKKGGRIYRSADFLHGGEYGTVNYNGIKIESVPAYNKNHNVNKCVGFLISIDGVKIYAAGDTSKTEYMSERLAAEKLDYAVLPIDGVFNMGPEQASECAEIIGAKHTIPVHMKVGALFDDKKAERFNACGKLVIKPGGKIKL